MENRNKGNTPIEKYLEYLDKIFQVEPQFFMNKSEIEGVGGVTSKFWDKSNLTLFLRLRRRNKVKYTFWRGCSPAKRYI